MTAPLRPPSASNFYINLSGGVTFILMLILARVFFPDADTLYVTLAGLAAALVPIILGELLIIKVHKRERVNWQSKAAPPDRQRVRRKLAGYYASLLIAGLCYFLLPEYNDEYYTAFRIFFLMILIPATISGWLFIEETDRHLPALHDNLWHFGTLVCGKWSQADKRAAFNHLKSVFLRVYFVPVVLIYSVKYIDLVMRKDILESAQALAGMNHIVDLPASGLFSFLLLTYLLFASIDVLFATIGYLVTTRVLDSDIRSVDSSVIGWVSCLFCYYPFWELIAVQLMFHDFYNNPAWYEWLAGNRPLFIIWGILTITAMTAESLTTLSFGVRFSNLTYRGLMSAGPFKFTKHPQYVSKLANRFLFFMPFLSPGGPIGALHGCLLYGGICFVYYIRARTEENHLCRYPEYVEYARWIDENGLFRFIGKLYPCLRFNPERAQKARLFPIGPI